MTVQTLDFPHDWLIENLSVLYHERPDLMLPLLESFLTSSEELRWNLVIKAYQSEVINLGKAAEFLGLHELELKEQFLTLGIPLRLGASDLAEAKAEFDAATSWFGHKLNQNKS